MIRSTSLLCAAALAGLLLQPATAVADARPEHIARAEQQDARQERRERRREQLERRREQREQVRRDSRDHDSDGGAQRAARIARQQNGGGRVLSVSPDGDGYRVRLLKDGEVRSYWIQGD